MKNDTPKIRINYNFDYNDERTMPQLKFSIHKFQMQNSKVLGGLWCDKPPILFQIFS